MKNLYIDFDGVILDTIAVTYPLLQERNIVPNLHSKEASEFYASLDWKELLQIAPQINDSISSIQKIMESGKFHVSILTHVNSLPEVVEKVHYIRQYFRDITIISVPKAISKTKMVETKDSILIDDYAGNLREWKEENGIGILFSKTLEDKGFPVINKLDQILDMIF